MRSYVTGRAADAAMALQAEVIAYVAAFADEVDEHGRGWWCATGTTTGVASHCLAEFL
jgi:hypothetical protein